jgi:hypothetical protein
MPAGCCVDPVLFGRILIDRALYCTVLCVSRFNLFVKKERKDPVHGLSVECYAYAAPSVVCSPLRLPFPSDLFAAPFPFLFSFVMSASRLISTGIIYMGNPHQNLCGKEGATAYGVLGAKRNGPVVRPSTKALLGG